MKRAPYIPFYPSDWLAGVADLSPAECGVYVNLLMLIYDGGGPIKADFPRLARRLNCPVSTLRAIVIGLCMAKKLTMADGFITNDRAEQELSKRSDKSEKARQSVMHREQKRQKNEGKNPGSDPSSARATTPDFPTETRAVNDRTITERSSNQNQNQNIPPISSDEDIAPPAGGRDAGQADAASPPKPKAANRGSRLPPDWRPSQADTDFAASQGLTHGETTHEAARFRDFWTAQPGAKGCKLDWPATWRNWCRTAGQQAADRRRREARQPVASGNARRPLSIVEVVQQRRAAAPQPSADWGAGSIDVPSRPVQADGAGGGPGNRAASADFGGPSSHWPPAA